MWKIKERAISRFGDLTNGRLSGHDLNFGLSHESGNLIRQSHLEHGKYGDSFRLVPTYLSYVWKFFSCDVHATSLH